VLIVAIDAFVGVWTPMSDSEGRSYRIGCYLGVLFTSAEGCSVRSGGRDCQFTGDGIGAVGWQGNVRAA